MDHVPIYWSATAAEVTKLRHAEIIFHCSKTILINIAVMLGMQVCCCNRKWNWLEVRALAGPVQPIL